MNEELKTKIYPKLASVKNVDTKKVMVVKKGSDVPPTALGVEFGKVVVDNCDYCGDRLVLIDEEQQAWACTRCTWSE